MIYYITSLMTDPDAIITIITAAVAYVILFFILKRRRKTPVIHIIICEFLLTEWAAMLIYISFLMWYTPDMSAHLNLNLIPFYSIYIAAKYNLYIGLWQYVLNIFIFVPLGILLPLVFSERMKRFKNVMLTGLIISFLIEMIQIIPDRDTDIDDIIMNVIGTVAGFMIYKLFQKINAIRK